MAALGSRGGRPLCSAVLALVLLCSVNLCCGETIFTARRSEAKALDAVKATVPKADQPCESKKGQCMEASTCIAPGRVEKGLCGGGATRMCCIGLAAAPATPTPTVAPAPAPPTPGLWERTKAAVSAGWGYVTTKASDAWTAIKTGFTRLTGPFGSTPTPPPPVPAPSTPPPPATPVAPPVQPPSPTGGKSAPASKEVSTAMQLVLNAEAGCQNHSWDSGNKCDGTTGYTCAGVTPCVGWAYKKYYSQSCQDSCKVKAEFTKCCWDLDSEGFKQSSYVMYEKEFFNAASCQTLPWPAFYLCADISVLSNPTRAKSIKAAATAELGECTAGSCDARAFCSKMNALYRAFLTQLAEKDSDKKKSLKGWNNRADAREKVCDGTNDPLK